VADLMCELLKHGAKPVDIIIQQSSVIRVCALGLVNLKGQQSIASAAAIVVRACMSTTSCQNVLNFNDHMHPFLFCKLPTHWHYR